MPQKIRVGILFGGPSREREVAFAGGRTVYDNLDKSLFTAVPIFIDSFKQCILLDWSYVYKGSIRDFYPPVEHLPASPHNFQIYVESCPEPELLPAAIGRHLSFDELSGIIDIAFLSLHGEFGEDGQIQGILTANQIPYTGCGIRASALGMDKSWQKQLMQAAGWSLPPYLIIQKAQLESSSVDQLYASVIATCGQKFVVKPSNQGSSIGVTVLEANQGPQALKQALEKALFIRRITYHEWNTLTPDDQIEFVREMVDLREQLGLPVCIHSHWIYHPEDLLQYLQMHFQKNQEEVICTSFWKENEVLVESFIQGKEFSCIVIRNLDGSPCALPPTHISQAGTFYTYKSKYLPGLSRKETPIDLPLQTIECIRKECERLYTFFKFQVYARIDGFYSEDGNIYLNDPNTTSGMMPSSFFFHQAAEIGLSPGNFLTYILHASLQERLLEVGVTQIHWNHLDRTFTESLTANQKYPKTKTKVAVIFGGGSFERHISIESGRNVFEKLSSSETYAPIPVFCLPLKEGGHRLVQIPINLMLKDNADDIRQNILHYSVHPVIQHIREETVELTALFSNASMVASPQYLTYAELAKKVDIAFIALHGRPGEDGEVQRELEKVGIPYNGSGPASSAITIDKYNTLQVLKEAGFSVTDQSLLQFQDWKNDCKQSYLFIEQKHGFPCIAKPVDDGCSSAVKKIRNQLQLDAYCQLLFGEAGKRETEFRNLLDIPMQEELPLKSTILFETLIKKEDAEHFLEITGGMLSTREDDGNIHFEVFEPSEALASGEVLSLEEKFLAGEGQNLTPARFSKNPEEQKRISAWVRNDLAKAAEVLGVEGYCRIDAFVRIRKGGDIETIIIEVNSLPGMTPATCIFHQAAIAGYTPFGFIDQILKYGMHANKSSVTA